MNDLLTVNYCRYETVAQQSQVAIGLGLSWVNRKLFALHIANASLSLRPCYAYGQTRKDVYLSLERIT